MPPLTDPERLQAYKNALGNWPIGGYVDFDLTQQSHDWIRRELHNISIRDLAHWMYDYVASGGTIDEVRETRPEWSDQHEFHYDLRFVALGKAVYVETRLIFRKPFVPDEPTIKVVNVHAP